MKKSKRSSSDDRLSKLPDSLIFEIFWLLRIRDVVRTTILSKHWRNLWKTSPFLNFTDRDHNNYSVKGTPEKERNFYNRALLLWRGDRLLKFKVVFRHQLSLPVVGDINVWLCLAKEKGVKELFLDLRYPKGEGDDYDTEAELESLFLCSSLEVLSIEDFPFTNGGNGIGNVKWDRLKSLKVRTSSLRKDLLSKVLCGSPKLEEFILHFDVGDEGGSWCIQSTSLKKLSITKNSTSYRYEEETEDTYEVETEMKIQTPNLETLEIKGGPYTKFSMDVAPLTDVTLGLHCEDRKCDYCDKSEQFLGIKGTLEQIIPTTQHVESLTLSECCLGVLGFMNNESLLSPLSNVKFLKLTTSTIHFRNFLLHLDIAHILQDLPKLKRLVIDDDNEYYGDVYEDDYKEDLEFEANLPNSFLLQLRTVEVTWATYDESIFLFIKTLLKYASKLEKMVFRVRRFEYHSDSLFEASEQLLRMPRSSPTAQLIFCKY